MSTENTNDYQAQFKISILENSTGQTIKVRYRCENGSLGAQVFEADSPMEILKPTEVNGEVVTPAVGMYSSQIPVDGFDYFEVEIYKQEVDGEGYTLCQTLRLRQDKCVTDAPKSYGFLTDFYVLDGNDPHIPREMEASGDVPDGDLLLLRIEKNADGGFIIGEIMMDPEPAYTLHTLMVEKGMLPEGEELIVKTEKGETIRIPQGEHRKVATRSLPIVKQSLLKAEDNRRYRLAGKDVMAGLFPVEFDVALSSNPEKFTRINCLLIDNDIDKAGEELIFAYHYGDDWIRTKKKKNKVLYEALKFGWMRAFLKYDPKKEMIRVDRVDTSPVSLEDRFPLLKKKGYYNHGPIHTVVGQVVNAKGKGIPECTVWAMDYDRFKKDDHMGNDVTNPLGFFELRWDERITANDLMGLDKYPDLYFRIASAYTLENEENPGIMAYGEDYLNLSTKAEPITLKPGKPESFPKNKTFKLSEDYYIKI